MLNDTPVACQTRGPTDPQGDRWHGEAVTDEASPRSGVNALFVSDWDSFAPRRDRFFCLRRPHFFQQRKKWGKERRQKLRFCTSSARYTCLLPSSFFLTRPAFSYPLSVSRLCQHSFPLPLPVTTVKIIRSAASQAKK